MTLKQALASGDSRKVIAAMRAGNRKRIAAQVKRCKAASKAAIDDMVAGWAESQNRS